jgi:hypothetical protein
MVGGRVVEKQEIRPGLVKLWCVDGADELAIVARSAPVMPELGEAIWWQGDKVFTKGDTVILEKVGYSFDPRKIIR